MALKVHIKWHSRPDLDQFTQDRSVYPISERGARIVKQRDRRCFSHHFIQRIILVSHLLLPVERRTPAAETGGMSEKMRHCYVTQTNSAFTDISTVWIHQHTLLREFRQIFLDRIIQLEFTRFMKLKHSGAGDFTGHGINAKQRVFWHRFLLFYIKPAQRFEINQLAIPGYCCHDPRNITVIDVLLKV